MTVDREMTFEDLLRMLGTAAVAEPVLEEEAEAANGAGAPGCGSGRCGCNNREPSPRSLPVLTIPEPRATIPDPRSSIPDPRSPIPDSGSVLGKTVDRRRALGMMFGGLAAGAQVASACSPLSAASDEEKELRLLEWRETIKRHYRFMTDQEREDTINRLERLAKLRRNLDINMQSTPAQPNVEFGYAFNISKCQGFRSCVEACINENNLDRAAATQYIRIFEMEDGVIDLDHADATFQHEVPAEGHFYLGTQCFQCADPPCVKVCPVGATWQEPDGITVVDYDWCIGCRYCMAACPYWARRFNWSAPDVPAAEVNPNQHYLGNRLRKKGVVEKCTFCIQRTRQGRLPACAEACPTGARVFGNLLDPNSEIRWVLANKPVFRLKEDLKTEPRFWYFTD